jgi:hypothetical protein
VVVPLGSPRRPLSKIGKAWRWQYRAAKTAGKPAWSWFRICHLHDVQTPDAVTHRPFGPLLRFDHHTANPKPRVCPEGRTVLYVGNGIDTVIGEVFGDTPLDATVCPRWRIAAVKPVGAIQTLDLASKGAAMALGALPSLASAPFRRYRRSQEWARAFYEDQPVAGKAIEGTYYRSAHANGPSIALWNTDGRIEVIRDASGRTQDFALVDPRIWPRIRYHANAVGITLRQVGNCTRCR